MGGHLGIFSIADARRLAQKRLPRMILTMLMVPPVMKRRRS